MPTVCRIENHDIVRSLQYEVDSVRSVNSLRFALYLDLVQDLGDASVCMERITIKRFNSASNLTSLSLSRLTGLGKRTAVCDLV